MTQVPDDLREECAELIAALRAVDEVVTDVAARARALEPKMNAVYGPSVPHEAWDRLGVYTAQELAAMIRERLWRMDAGLGTLGVPYEETAAEHGLPVEDYAALARRQSERLDREEAYRRRMVERERRPLEDQVFEMLTDGLDGD